MTHGYPLMPKNQDTFDKKIRADLGHCPYCGKNAVCICPDVIAELPVLYIDAIVTEYDADHLLDMRSCLQAAQDADDADTVRTLADARPY